MTFLFYFQPFLLDGYFITQNESNLVICQEENEKDFREKG